MRLLLAAVVGLAVVPGFAQAEAAGPDAPADRPFTIVVGQDGETLDLSDLPRQPYYQLEG